MTWYVVDGMDGSGKSTVGRLIEDKMLAQGRKVLFLEHPNDSCRSGRLAHKYLLKHGKFAMILSTTFYIFNVIHSLRFKRKHRGEYDDIVFVRYNMAVAYLPKCLIRPGYRFISFIFPRPDVSIFVDIDPESAMRRILSRGEDLEMFETEEKLKKTREKMLILSNGWNIVDNTHGLEQTRESVEWILSEVRNKE